MLRHLILRMSAMVLMEQANRRQFLAHAHKQNHLQILSLFAQRMTQMSGHMILLGAGLLSTTATENHLSDVKAAILIVVGRPEPVSRYIITLVGLSAASTLPPFVQAKTHLIFQWSGDASEPTMCPSELVI